MVLAQECQPQWCPKDFLDLSYNIHEPKRVASFLFDANSLLDDFIETQVSTCRQLRLSPQQTL